MKRSSIIKKYLKENRSYFATRQMIAESINPSVDISVVIPSYNEELCLPKLLLSLNNQTYHNFEVIVVDNDSTNKSKETISSWKSKVNYSLYFVSELNKGAASARKRGMDEAFLRAVKKDALSSYLIVTTDADATPSYDWLEKIHLKAKGFKSTALAGTHQAAKEVDMMIEQKLGIKDFFNLAPLLIKAFLKRKSSVIKMSGPNSAFEIEAYAAGGGMKQEYDEAGQLKLNETNSLGNRIRSAGYPVFSMETRVITSKRRQLKEILYGGNSYFPEGYLETDRFCVVRENEYDLLELALEKVDKSKWMDYRYKIILTVLSNLLMPSYSGCKSARDISKLNIQISKLSEKLAFSESITARDLQTMVAKEFTEDKI